MKSLFKWLVSLFVSKRDVMGEADEAFFRPIMFLFPNILKESVSSQKDIEDWKKDYL